MWDRLPSDVHDLILRHRAALLVQRRWLRHVHYAHARYPGWPVVRANLQSLGVWKTLFPYAHVRREWRSEPLSWLFVDDGVAACLRREVRMGLWGTTSPRVRE